MFVPLVPLEFRDRAEMLFAKKIGVIDGEMLFTYAQFGARTHQLANALRANGLEKGDRVSFITYNTHQLLEGYYGVIEAGGILNPINVRLTPQDISYILNHSASKFVFFHNDFLPLIQAIKPVLTATKCFIVMEGEGKDVATDEYEAFLASANADYHRPDLDENDIAELFYTSGTTGKPKGAATTHRTLYLHALYSALGLGVNDSDVILHIVPLFHVNGWGTPQTLTMMGGTHVMLRKIDPTMLLSLVQKHKVTRMFGVPTIFNALLNFPDLPKYDLSSVKNVVLGGAPSAPALVKAIQEKFGCQCIVGYGLTETSPVLTLARPKAHLAGEPLDMQMARQAKTGYPLPGVQLRVMDANGNEVKADGKQIGEITVHSNVVMDGYYHDPDATKNAIRDGWFHTGDMAVVDDEGYVLIVDRSKDIIISGGENISSVEIENCLYANPKVFECAVVAVPDEKWGEVPKALVVLKPGQTATEEEFFAYCKANLAGFKVPKSIEFRDSLPKGGTGKILKANLRNPFWEGKEKRVN
ncbi:MAG: fatty acid--CoA ligase [Chloroflexi bacterium]|nr:fatty acid--CoA ligase [Chloroflexota bacterium]